jgi:hypothetical protein
VGMSLLEQIGIVVGYLSKFIQGDAEITPG